jgi:hypothetical protein
MTAPQYLDGTEDRSTALTVVFTDKLAQMIERVIRIQKAFSSSPGGNTDYPMIVHGFSQSLQKKTEINSQIMTPLLHSTFTPILC